MKVDAYVLVAEVMNALHMDALPAGSTLKKTDTVTVTVVVDDDEIREELPLNEPFGLSEHLDQTEVIDLAAAIRRGDTAEAEILLDRLLASDDAASEWVQQGRFSRNARQPRAEMKRAA